VTRSYRLGIQVVLGAIVLAAAFSLAWAARRGPVPARAAQQVPPGAFPLGEFQLRERSGRGITQADLRNRVCVFAFIFSRCPLSCPRISTVMKDLQTRFDGTNVLLASVTVDPEYDTAAVLTQYAQRFGASPDRWWFLTGDKEQIHDLVERRFKLGLQEASPAERASGSEAITHSDRLVLVEDGQVVGFFESNDATAVDALVAQANRRALPGWVKRLPTLNATLNGVCAVLLIAGWVLIRSRHSRPRSGSPSSGPASDVGLVSRPVVRGHVALMLSAVGLSALFLTSYLVYHSRAGATVFQSDGFLRVLYLTILFSHLSLAIAVIPLVSLTLIRAIRRNYASHLAIAQLTFPIWLYVAITGVVIYLMLYHLPTQPSLGRVII
jgi:protein SCO1/2/putative membrane protein